MEYRFSAKKSWNIPTTPLLIIYGAMFLSHFFPKHLEYPWINISIIVLFFLFLGWCFRELSARVVLIISDQGLSYAGDDYLFAPKCKKILVSDIEQIYISRYKPTSWLERQKTAAHIVVLSDQNTILGSFLSQTWQPLDGVSLDQAFQLSFSAKVAVMDEAAQQQIEKLNFQALQAQQELGKVAEYFTYASVGITIACITLAFLDLNITIVWGSYEYLIWSIAAIIALVCVITLLRSKTQMVAVVLVPLLFTTVTTFLIHQSLMLLNYHLGSQKIYTFEKVSQTKEYELWKAATGEEIQCAPSPRELYSYKRGVVREGVLGIVRTHFKEVCL